MIALSRPDVDGSSAYHLFRLVDAGPPKANLTTVADRVAARLGRHIDSGLDFGTTGTYVPHLPTRLSSSAALRNATALLCACWEDYRRHQTVKLMPMKQYGLALRSIQQAIDGRQRLNVETLAAVSLLNTVTLLFEGDQGPQSVVHLRGMAQLMSNRGPPRLTDPLDCALTRDNHGILVCIRPPACHASGAW
jgi:hypothetical protein